MFEFRHTQSTFLARLGKLAKPPHSKCGVYEFESRSGYVPFKDPEAKRAYQRAWLQDKRNRAIELLGGQCVKCGVTENLEFDHIDPTTKDPSLRHWRGNHNQSGYGFSFSRSWTFIVEELKKCQLLCSSCHWSKNKS